MTLSEDVRDVALDVELTTPVAPLARIRHWLATVLTDLGGDLLQDLMLVCTELVANAYDHARGPRHLRVHRAHDRRIVRVEVRDGSPDRLPEAGTSSLRTTRGRGLLLVDTVSAHRWGTRITGDTKAVWAELSLP